jgi:hypothetical protein
MSGSASNTGLADAMPSPALVNSGETNPKVITKALSDARQALAKADAAVDQDKRNHSPDCVAFDQKAVDKASADLAQAKSEARAAGILDVTV